MLQLKNMQNLWLLGLIFLLFSCQQKSSEHEYAGYVESQLIVISAPIGGKLKTSVRRGQEIKAGVALFALDNVREEFALKKAQARVNQMQATVDNLQKGVRKSEMAALIAQLDAAQADALYAQKELRRNQQLFRDNAISASRLDVLKNQVKAANSRVRSAKAQIETASKGARSDEVQAALSALEVAKAEFNEASWAFDEQVQYSPVEGQVYEVFYEPDELVPPNGAVVRLLDRQMPIRVHFYVPEKDLAFFRKNLGTKDQAVEVRWRDDSRLPEKYLSSKAVVVFIADFPEYTPPIIFSNQTRDNLVYHVEAQIAPSVDKTIAVPHSGQPVSVVLP